MPEISFKDPPFWWIRNLISALSVLEISIKKTTCVKKLYNALSHLQTIDSYFSMNIKTIIFLEIVNKYHNTSVFLWKVNFKYKRWIIIFIHMEYMEMLMNDADFF